MAIMHKEEYADFDYVIEGLIADLCQLARAKKRKSTDGWNDNIKQATEKLKILKII